MVSLYGALALVPLFLLWIYWSWIIILAGVALSFIVQYLPADEHWARRLVLPSDPRLLVPIMVRIADAFERGEKLTTARLSLELGVPPRILRPYVRVLERAGLRARAARPRRSARAHAGASGRHDQGARDPGARSRRLALRWPPS